MSIQHHHIRIFVASPADVSKERDQLASVVKELNETIAPHKDFSLELVRWETHCAPAIGRPQGVVNAQIGSYDIFVGIMWKRFGSPTGHAGSGTEEEFRIACDSWQKDQSISILFYFCQEPFMPCDVEELDQCREVLVFYKEISKDFLVWKYSEHDVFADVIRPQLTRLLLNDAKWHGASLPSTAILKSPADEV